MFRGDIANLPKLCIVLFATYNLVACKAQKRMALARALALAPDILLLDEPLANLDAGAKSELIDLIRTSVKNTVATLIYVSHDPVEAEKLCDRFLVISNTGLSEIPLEIRRPVTTALIQGN